MTLLSAPITIAVNQKRLSFGNVRRRDLNHRYRAVAPLHKRRLTSQNRSR